MHTGNYKGHGRHHSRLVQGFVFLASAARRFIGVDVRAVGIGLHRWPLTQACRGIVLTRVLIRNGDHSANGIAPIAVRDRMTSTLAFRELRRSPSARQRGLAAMVLNARST
jgi:hypothetical protein